MHHPPLLLRQTKVLEHLFQKLPIDWTLLRWVTPDLALIQRGGIACALYHAFSRSQALTLLPLAVCLSARATSAMLTPKIDATFDRAVFHRLPNVAECTLSLLVKG